MTGPPGTGKSTLVDRLIAEYRRAKLKVGVIAVDPTSPITGGALLGDRVRMVQHTMDSGVFIRSMASRGWSGGLSGAVSEAIQILDAGGMDVVIIETVGIGQSDIEVMKIAHAVIVVTMPGLGDDIQVSKAGLMEIGDVYAVNKSDLPGADAMVINLSRMVRDMKGRSPPVLKVSALKGEGVDRPVRARSRRSAPSSSLPRAEEMRLRSVRGMMVELAKRKLLGDFEEQGARSSVPGARREGRGPQDHLRGGGRAPRGEPREISGRAGERGGDKMNTRRKAERIRPVGRTTPTSEEDVTLEAKKRIIDSLGCAIGAFGEAPVKIARKVAESNHQGGSSTILGRETKTSPDLATFVNGLMVRYFDYNDTYLSKEPAHPSDNISACLAVGEREGSSGKDLLTAIVLAYEVQCRLCDAADIRHRGWDHVCYGLVSSALAAGKLMGLSEAEAHPFGQHLAERAHRDEAGEGGRALRMEGRLLRQRREERRLLSHARGAGDDRTVPDLRGRDGVLQAGLRPLRAGHLRGSGEERNRFKLGGDLHQVLPGRVPRPERHLGRSRRRGGRSGASRTSSPWRSRPTRRATPY